MNDNDLLINQIERHDSEIDELRKTTAQLEKTQSNIELSLSHLSENISKLSFSVEQLAEEIKSIKGQIDPLKRYIDDNKGFKNFIKDNWFRIPQAAVIVGAMLYAANWLYDLPSPTQLEQMQQLSEMRSNT